MPKDFLRILNGIKVVLGSDAEVIIAPTGIYAQNSRGKFFCLPTCSSLPAWGAFKLPPDWGNLANSKLVKGMRYQATRNWIHNGHLQIASPFWIMDAVLEEISVETLTGYPVYRCNEQLPVIKTNISSTADGKMLITTARGKFVLNI